MGPDPLLSASLPLPLALSTTLQDNYVTLVRQGKGVKLNSHWLSLIAFLDLLDYKLNWRTWRAMLGRLSMCENVCERKSLCVYVRLCLFCISCYTNEKGGGYLHVCVCSAHSSLHCTEDDLSWFSYVRQIEILIRPYQCVCVSVMSCIDGCYRG